MSHYYFQTYLIAVPVSQKAVKYQTKIYYIQSTQHPYVYKRSYDSITKQEIHDSYGEHHSIMNIITRSRCTICLILKITNDMIIIHRVYHSHSCFDVPLMIKLNLTGPAYTKVIVGSEIYFAALHLRSTNKNLCLNQSTI